LGLFFKSPVEKLEDAVEKNPSPEAFAALAQKHIEDGDLGAAIRTADQGLQTFRGNGKLKDIVLFVKKKQSQDTVKHLRDEIRVKPSPMVYSQLAGIHRELGDIEQALDLLSECTEKFPKDENAFRMLGQIRLENFLQEVIAYDGLHAYRTLRRVQEIAPDDIQGRMLLAQLYFAVGGNALAVKELQAELDRNATALDLKSFLEDLGAAPPPEGEVNVEALIERCEESGALVNSLKGFPRVKPGIAQRTGSAPKINVAAAMVKVNEAAGMPGVANISVLDREGKAVGSIRAEEAMDVEVFRELAWSIQSVAWESCRRMDIGSFARGAVALPGGGIIIIRRRGTTFAMGFRDPLKHDRASALLEDLVGKVVGGAHA
jgi:tetratricopeptide (TPR) repeat protein